MATAVLIVRLIIGLGIAAHGAQKLFGWFGGYGIAGTGQFFESLGFRPGVLFATLAGLGEFFGGLLTALGLLNPIGPALIAVVMLTAIFSVHIRNGFFVENKGWELPILYLAGALLIAFTGVDRFSLDAAFGLHLWGSSKALWSTFGVSLILALLNLLSRRPAPQPQQKAA
jgi:putative oxidoreductase